MDWISSSMGRAAGVLTTGRAGGVCTGADTGGIWAIGEPQRLQKTDSAGTLLPHFEQNTLVPGEEVSDCLTADGCGTVVTRACCDGSPDRAYIIHRRSCRTVLAGRG